MKFKLGRANIIRTRLDSFLLYILEADVKHGQSPVMRSANLTGLNTLDCFLPSQSHTAQLIKFKAHVYKGKPIRKKLTLRGEEMKQLLLYMDLLRPNVR